MLVAEQCSAAYGEPAQRHVVFQETDFTVGAGEIVTIVGPSGCGKSTLLLVLAGLKPPLAGSVRVHGSSVARGDPRVGLVLQHYGLFPWYTALQNVTLGLRIRDGRRRPRGAAVGPARAARDAAGARARDLLLRLGLAGKENRYPRDLSGGEQQRVALARTLVLEPQVLLLDEPFSALDALTREELQDQLRALLHGSGIGAVMVTHSIDEAVYLGHRVGILASESGAPARLQLAANPFPPGTLGRSDTSSEPGELDRARRTHPEFLTACAAVRARFREVVGA